MVSISWPCRVAQDLRGNYRVVPFQITGCEGAGDSLEGAREAAQAAVTKHLQARAGDFIVPPIVVMDPEEIVQGRLIQIQVEVA